LAKARRKIIIINNAIGGIIIQNQIGGIIIQENMYLWKKFLSFTGGPAESAGSSDFVVFIFSCMSFNLAAFSLGSQPVSLVIIRDHWSFHDSRNAL